jgi:hypothetical protein
MAVVTHVSSESLTVTSEQIRTQSLKGRQDFDFCRVPSSELKVGNTNDVFTVSCTAESNMNATQKQHEIDTKVHFTEKLLIFSIP